jgi:hypothetical protein
VGTWRCPSAGNATGHACSTRRIGHIDDKWWGWVELDDGTGHHIDAQTFFAGPPELTFGVDASGVQLRDGGTATAYPLAK